MSPKKTMFIIGAPNMPTSLIMTFWFLVVLSMEKGLWFRLGGVVGDFHIRCLDTNDIALYMIPVYLIIYLKFHLCLQYTIFKIVKWIVGASRLIHVTINGLENFISILQLHFFKSFHILFWTLHETLTTILHIINCLPLGISVAMHEYSSSLEKVSKCLKE